MASRKQTQLLPFNGGYATDLAAQVRELNYLTRAENVIYEVSGAVRKVGGATRLNGTVLTGAPSVLGMFDFWIAGAAGSFTQNFVVTTSASEVYSFGTGGTATDITGAATIGADAIPVFVQARDLLTMWWSDASTPLKYSGTGNVASLGGTPPVARCAAFHLNRLWAAGTNANPSRLYYGSSVNAEDWSGADTGSFEIDPEDGDRIVGLASYKRRLFVFKGPNKGSIHVLSGTAPTGADAFSRTVLVRGLALQSPNSLVAVGDDILLMSQYGIHSLVATERFGDFQESLITRYLMGYFRDNVSRTRLSTVWGVNYAAKGCVIWALTPAGGSVNNQVFGLSYIRREEEGVKPFIWNRSCQSAVIRHSSTGQKELVFGSNTGFVLRQDTTDRNIESSTAYTFRLATPQVILGVADSAGQQRFDQPVTLHRLYLRTRPVGNYDINVSLQRDDESPELYTFNQGASIGFVLGTSQLGIGTLGGGTLRLGVTDLVGECRSIALDITQGGFDQDANIYEMGIEFTPTSESSSSSL